MLRELGPGCTLPVAALAHSRANTITLAARLLDDQGKHQIDIQRSGEDAEEIGQEIGNLLLSQLPTHKM